LGLRLVACPLQFDAFHRAFRLAFGATQQWLHEIKFNGWRIQLQKHGGSAPAFTKNGHDPSSRVRWMVDSLACLKGVQQIAPVMMQQIERPHAEAAIVSG
jgi:ATP-dependent DNA ligase